MSQRALRSNVLKALGLALLIAAGGARAASAAEVVSTRLAPAPEAPAIPVKDNAILLTLDEAIEIALRHNLDIVLERYIRNQTRLAIEQSLGIYDLLLTSTASASDQTSATASALEASQSNTRVFNVGVSQLLPSGGTVGVGFNNSRQENNLSFSTLNPAFNSGLTFTFDQPLLRNFGRELNERNIVLARSRSDVERRQFELQVTNTIQQVTNAYWNLVGAREQLVVAEESLSLAKDLHERNRIQVEVGTVAPLELVSSEAAIATNEENIIRAKSAVGDAEDTLRRLLNLAQGPLWNLEIRPATDPVTERPPINLDEAIQSALARRPELLQQQQLVEQARLNATFFHNQTKPSLNLHLDYTASGVGGDLVVRDPDTGEVLQIVPGGYGNAFSQVTGFGFIGWTARLVFSYPLQNRAAKAQSLSSDLDVERALTTLEQQRQSIITEVRQAARRVDTAAKSIDAAKISTEFQLKNLDAQKKRYENGMSTTFEITRIQQDVTTARSNEVTAIIAYRTALADLYRATGRLLEVQGVELEDPVDRVNRWQFHLWRR